MANNELRFPELALVLVRLDHVASRIHKRESRRHVRGCEPCLRNARAPAMVGG